MWEWEWEETGGWLQLDGTGAGRGDVPVRGREGEGDVWVCFYEASGYICFNPAGVLCCVADEKDEGCSIRAVLLLLLFPFE